MLVAYFIAKHKSTDYHQHTLIQYLTFDIVSVVRPGLSKIFYSIFE